MRILILLGCSIVIGLATPIALQLDTHNQWKQFKLKHSKTYENAKEEQQRFEIFHNKLKKIEEHNKFYDTGLVSYRLGVNQFTDWTQEEFVSYLTKFGRPQQEYIGIFVRPLDVQLPTVDWRKMNLVTPPKDQKDCGACWAFSTTGALEGQNALKTRKLVSFSEQELVDCSTVNNGCDGGLMINAFAYVRDNGLTIEEAYPYEAVQGECRNSNTTRAVNVTGFRQIESGNENDLQAAVAFIGPISVGVDATDWSDYADGIFNGSCGSDRLSLNHAVLVVGYGRSSWIIKNSWGTGWGEGGFIRIPRYQNKCGVATDASYPVL